MDRYDFSVTDPTFIGDDGLVRTKCDDGDFVYYDDAQAEIARLTAERDAAIKALCEAATARGQAEGKLAASEMAGVVEGWKTRATAAEAYAARLEDAMINRIETEVDETLAAYYQRMNAMEDSK